MRTHIALLRGINVGGHARIAMSDLRNLLVELGFADVRSLLQTGNLVFRGDGGDSSEMEHMLEAEAARRLGLRTDFLVRTAEEWARIVECNPFPELAERDPGHLVVMFLKQPPDETTLNGLRTAVMGSETIRAEGSHIYITYPDGIGRSRLTGTLIESKLATRGTARNWNTVLKLASLARTFGSS